MAYHVLAYSMAYLFLGLLLAYSMASKFVFGPLYMYKFAFGLLYGLPGCINLYLAYWIIG